jgi:ribonuclease P protein component
MGSRESARAPRRRLRTLVAPWQFRYCYQEGRKVVTRHSVVFMRAPAELDGLCVGVVASRKVGGAVRRNRARRLLREAARALAHRWIDRNTWVVFVAKASIIDRSAREVQDDIERALVESGALAAKNIE